MLYFLRVSVFSSDTYGVKILNLDICILEFISLLGKRFWEAKVEYHNLHEPKKKIMFTVLIGFDFKNYAFKMSRKSDKVAFLF